MEQHLESLFRIDDNDMLEILKDALGTVDPSLMIYIPACWKLAHSAEDPTDALRAQTELNRLLLLAVLQKLGGS